MTSGGAHHYGLRFKDGLIPTVEVTIFEDRPTLLPDGNGGARSNGVVTRHHVVVARRRGFTRGQAFLRAVAWTGKHGDPRGQI